MNDKAATGPNRDIPDWLRPFAVVVAMVAVMWVVEVIDLIPRVDPDRWGIRPREMRGLTGVVAAPFLHNGFGHLIGNTIPLLILGSVIAFSGMVRVIQVTVIVMLVSGLATWLIGSDNTIHIGASGLVFGYLAYLLARAVFERKFTYLIGGVIVLFLYGGVLWGLIPRPGISWEGHLFGAVGGVLAARFIHAPKERTLPDAV